MKSRTASALFLICAFFALAVHFFLFEMRYTWYVTSSDYWALTGGYAACAGAIIVCWAILPSRALVGLIGLLALFFPHFIYTASDRPLLGRSIDSWTVGVAIASVALLVFATQLRRRCILAK